MARSVFEAADSSVTARMPAHAADRYRPSDEGERDAGGDGGPVRLGRRRDPDIDQRSRDAAVSVYSHSGLLGLTFNAVAREARVGKPALYRRWESPGQLLIDAFAHLDLPAARDCGSLRADLLDYGMQLVTWYSRGYAGLWSRIVLDRREDPALDELYRRQIYRPRMEAAREMTERALYRGEISSSADALLAIELLLGALNTRWLFTAEPRLARRPAMLEQYVETAVEVIISGLPTPGQD